MQRSLLGTADADVFDVPTNAVGQPDLPLYALGDAQPFLVRSQAFDSIDTRNYLENHHIAWRTTLQVHWYMKMPCCSVVLFKTM